MTVKYKTKPITLKSQEPTNKASRPITLSFLEFWCFKGFLVQLESYYGNIYMSIRICVRLFLVVK